MNVRNEPLHDMACVVKRETPPVLRWKLCEVQNRKSISVSQINLIVWRGSKSETDFTEERPYVQIWPRFQVIQVISSAKFWSAEEIDLSFISIKKPLLTKPPNFKSLLFGKETVKTILYRCSNLGINESTSQTQSNVSWISSKAEPEISLLKSPWWKKLRKRDLKIDPVIGFNSSESLFFLNSGKLKIGHVSEIVHLPVCVRKHV